MKRTIISCAAAVALFLCACNTDHARDQASRSVQVIPDSLRNEFLIAAFYENDPSGLAVLRYNDQGRKTARKIKFLDEGGVLVQNITPLSEKDFRCEECHIDYRVDEKSVLKIYSGVKTHISVTNLPVVEELERTDVKDPM